MKETAVSLLAGTTTEGRRAPREALRMNRNAASSLRGAVGVHTSQRRFHGGLNVQLGGWGTPIGEGEEAKEAGGRGLECARNAAAAQTYLCALNAYVSILAALVPVSPADLSVRA